MKVHIHKKEKTHHAKNSQNQSPRLRSQSMNLSLQKIPRKK